MSDLIEIYNALHVLENVAAQLAQYADALHLTGNTVLSKRLDDEACLVQESIKAVRDGVHSMVVAAADASDQSSKNMLVLALGVAASDMQAMQSALPALQPEEPV